MEIIHDKDSCRVWMEQDGERAFVGYEIGAGSLSIYTTQVPKALEGQGIAAKLVEFTYDYAASEGLRPMASCSYAVAWLKRKGLL